MIGHRVALSPNNVDTDSIYNFFMDSETMLLHLRENNIETLLNFSLFYGKEFYWFKAISMNNNDELIDDEVIKLLPKYTNKLEIICVWPASFPARLAHEGASYRQASTLTIIYCATNGNIEPLKSIKLSDEC